MDNAPKSPFDELAELGKSAISADQPTQEPALQQPPSGSSKTRLNVSRYLDHHGIEYKTDTGQFGQSIWKLRECPFNPDHTHWKNWVGQTDTGAIYWKCMHTSCPSGPNAWQQLKSKLSGTKKLTPWMDGINLPVKSKPQNKKTPASDPPDPEKTIKEYGFDPYDDVYYRPSEAAAPAPRPFSRIPQGVFYTRNPYTSRTSFHPAIMSNVIAQEYEHMVSSEGVFYWFSPCGFWEILEEAEVKKTVSEFLGNHYTPEMGTATVQVLQDRLNRSEKLWNENTDYICCANGMISIKALLKGDIKGALVPHDQKYDARYQIPARFEIDADMDPWYRILTGTFPNAPGRIQLLQELFGYSLLRKCPHEIIVIFYGTGSNGKSLILLGLRVMVGDDNVCSLSLEAIGDKHQTHLLQNKMVNLAPENPQKKQIDTEFLKLIAGDEALLANPKFGNPYNFFSSSKHFFSVNMLPKIYDPSLALVRRLVILPFEEQFLGDRQDRSLKEKVKQMADGILLWSVGGLISLLQRGSFYSDEAIERGKSDFIHHLNPIKMFCRECLDVDETKNSFAYTQDVYRVYQKWADDNGQPRKALRNMAEEIALHFAKTKYTKHPDNTNRRSILTHIKIFDDLAATPPFLKKSGD